MNERQMKIYVTVVNFLGVAFGLLICGMGIYGLVQAKYGAKICGVAVVIGIFAAGSAILGCLAIRKKNRLMLLIFGVLYTVIFILTVITLISALIRHSHVANMEKFLEDEYKFFDKEKTFFMRTLHKAEKKKECCGIYDYQDYKKMGRDLPGSCCGDDIDEKCDEDDAHQKGCGETIFTTFQTDFLIMIILAVIALVIEMNAIAVALLLAYKYQIEDF